MEGQGIARYYRGSTDSNVLHDTPSSRSEHSPGRDRPSLTECLNSGRETPPLSPPHLHRLVVGDRDSPYTLIPCPSVRDRLRDPCGGLPRPPPHPQNGLETGTRAALFSSSSATPDATAPAIRNLVAMPFPPLPPRQSSGEKPCRAHQPIAQAHATAWMMAVNTGSPSQASFLYFTSPECAAAAMRLLSTLGSLCASRDGLRPACDSTPVFSDRLYQRSAPPHIQRAWESHRQYPQQAP